MKYPTRFSHFGWEYLEKADYNGSETLHPGIDFNNGRPWEDLGQNVISITDGCVKFAKKGDNNGFGNLILLYHPNHNIWSQYAHLQSISVKEGDCVKEGQKIGTLGGTPNYVPHLHFEIRVKDIPAAFWQWSLNKYDFLDKYVDPLLFIKKYLTDGKLSKDEMLRKCERYFKDNWQHVGKQEKVEYHTLADQIRKIL